MACNPFSSSLLFNSSSADNTSSNIVTSQLLTYKPPPPPTPTMKHFDSQTIPKENCRLQSQRCVNSCLTGSQLGCDWIIYIKTHLTSLTYSQWTCWFQIRSIPSHCHTKKPETAVDISQGLWVLGFFRIILIFYIAQRELIFLSNKIFLVLVCVKHHVGTGIKKIQP